MAVIGISPPRMLDALVEADDGHDCPAPGYLFDDSMGETVIRCLGCRKTIWRRER